MADVTLLYDFVHAIQDAHSQGKTAIVTLSLSSEGQSTIIPSTLEFEILPPTLEVTDKRKGGKKK